MSGYDVLLAGTSVEVNSQATSEEVESLLVRTAARSEARWRSANANVLVTSGCALVAIGPHIPGASHVLGDTTGTQAACIAAVAWSVYELAALAFHVLGPNHAATVVLSVLDTLDRYAVFLALVYLSGSAASPLWVPGMVNAFVWTAKPLRTRRIDLALLLGTHALLALAFLRGGHAGDAWLTLLVLLASTAGHTMTARMVARSSRVRAERDVIVAQLREATLRRDRERMARELHDGVGADVMALVLRLRRVAGDNPRTARLAERARDLLDELRSVVWSLRNEQGTLAELGKLIDATCRGVRGELAYERTTPLAAAQARVGPSASLAALSIARELARNAATRGGVSRLSMTLSIGEALELTVDDDGPSLAVDALERSCRALALAERPLHASPAHIHVSNRSDAAGVRVHASIALDAPRAEAAKERAPSGLVPPKPAS